MGAGSQSVLVRRPRAGGEAGVRVDGRPAGGRRPGGDAGRMPHRAGPAALPTGTVPMSRQLAPRHRDLDFHAAANAGDWHRAEHLALSRPARSLT